MTRQELLKQLTEIIISINRPHPVRVAIDGVDAAGKTIFTNELAGSLEKTGKHVIQASIDGFHRSRKDRYVRGADSAQGYYYDSFDYDALKQAILIPLGPGGNCKYCRAVFDYRIDSPVQEPLQKAPTDSILLFDGVFLLGPELYDHWDYRVFVKVDFQTVLQRVVSRDQHLFGTPDKIRARYLKRYIPGQKIYLHKARPEENADVVIINDDPVNPRIIFQHNYQNVP